MKSVAGAVLAVVALTLAGCSAPTADQDGQRNQTVQTQHQEEVTLVTGGYGYEVGDIVLIDKQKQPEPGDVVQSDARINKSYCLAFGPGVHLARVIGRPGDRARFSECSVEANGYTVSFRCGWETWPPTKLTMWGTTRYEDVAGMELVVPDGEYLADRLVGLECPPGEVDQTGSSRFFHRFTIKQEALKGVLVKKLGHDSEFERRQKQIVY